MSLSITWKTRLYGCIYVRIFSVYMSCHSNPYNYIINNIIIQMNLPTWRTFSTHPDSSNFNPLQKLKFCESAELFDDTL